uniref:hypothetical protein n=1 Tax=Alcaligenes sp. EGD-AK7 TaxID=1386079 RepID=UPI0009EAA8FA|nr:hypothetical protein [Alcaligenes sp. EGD-AK7]
MLEVDGGVLAGWELLQEEGLSWVRLVYCFDEAGLFKNNRHKKNRNKSGFFKFICKKLINEFGCGGRI